MEKGKNVEVKTTEESLRMKLRRFKQEIQEMGERRIEVELATVAAQAKSAALNVELAAKMARYSTMNEETVVMRKEHDVFNNDITMRLQKIRGKCSFFNQEANSDPKDTYPGATEEDADDEIIYMPPFLGHLKGGDKKITLPAYEWTHSVGARVVPCALIYEHLKVSGMLKPLEGTTFGFGHESTQKICAYHPNQRGHTIEKCVELKAAIRNLINVGEIPYMWGEITVLTCDQSEPSMSVTKHTLFYCHYFTPFKKTLLGIYSQMVRKGIMAFIRKDGEVIDPVGSEIWKPCPYHDAIDHNIGRCLGFRYDVESFINMGKIQVEFTPRD